MSEIASPRSDLSESMAQARSFDAIRRLSPGGSGIRFPNRTDSGDRDSRSGHADAASSGLRRRGQQSAGDDHPIINLRRLFDLEAEARNDETRTIVANVGQRTIGCTVDAVTQVIRITSENIQPAPDLLKSKGASYIAGFAKVESRLVILLEISELLDPSKLEQVRDIARRGLALPTRHPQPDPDNPEHSTASAFQWKPIRGAGQAATSWSSRMAEEPRTRSSRRTRNGVASRKSPPIDFKQLAESTTVRLILADLDLKIVYMNAASIRTLRELQHLLPCRVDEIIGQSIDIFHRNPEQQRKLLSNPKNLPYRAEIRLGPEILDLNVSAIYDSSGTYVGPMVNWSVVTAAANQAAISSAISKSQAMIEFQLDGTIITANDNFLQVMGYSLEEIQGRHHSLFIDDSLRQSEEYRAFWEKLNAGSFRRVNSGGRPAATAKSGCRPPTTRSSITSGGPSRS